MQPKTFIFFGRSGSGKGTQTKILIDYLKSKEPDRGVIYISTGTHIREFMKGDGYTNRMVREMIDRGGLLPEFIPIWIWTNYIIENYTGNEHFVFDGLSRRVLEAPVLDSALKFYERKNPVIIDIQVSDIWAVERLLGRGRKDDKPEEIKARLSWYDKNVLPAVDLLKNTGNYQYVEVNGERSIEEVSADIKAIVHKE